MLIRQQTFAFTDVLTAIADMDWQSGLLVEQIPAPSKLAPYATAIAAELLVRDIELSNGRLVLLHDPAGNDIWEGDFRAVAYANAKIDPEMGADPALADVGWTWQIEALERNAARYACPSGTVTTIFSKYYGTKQSDNPQTEVELRSSWTPLITQPQEITAHLHAWSELLCFISGLPPTSNTPFRDTFQSDDN